MTGQQPDPVTRPALRIVTGSATADDLEITAPAVTGTEAVADPVTTVPDPVTAGAVVPLTTVEWAATALRHWGGNAASIATGLWLRPDRLLYILWHGKPGSIAENRAYVKSRAWVPEELKGTRAGKVIAFLGVAYYVVIAPVKAVIKAADAATDRPLRVAGLLILIIVLLIIVF